MQGSQGMLVSRLAMEVATACATAAIGVAVSVGATEFGIGWGDAGPEPGYFPFYVGLLIIAGSLGTLVQALVQRRRLALPFLDAVQAGRIAAFFGPMAAFVVATMLLGLYAATSLYLCAVMWLQGGYRLPFAVVVSVAMSVFFYLVFEVWFQVPLLKGPIEAWLGLS